MYDLVLQLLDLSKSYSVVDSKKNLAVFESVFSISFTHKNSERCQLRDSFGANKVGISNVPSTTLESLFYIGGT